MGSRRLRRAIMRGKAQRSNRARAEWVVPPISKVQRLRDEADAREFEANMKRRRAPVSGAKGLFTPPFKVDEMCPIYIWDAHREMVADWLEWHGDKPRARNWGRIKHLPNAEALDDEWHELFNGLAEGAEDIHEMCRRLNEEWGRAEGVKADEQG